MTHEFTAAIPQTLGWGTFIHILSVLALIAHILRKPGEPRTSLLWIFFASVFPLVGISAYILFGVNAADDKGWEKQHSDIHFNLILNHFREPTDPLEFANRSEHPDKINAIPKNLQTLNVILDQTGPYHPLLGGNSVKLQDSAEKALEEMFAAIKGARSNIKLSTYILADDAVGRRLMDALKERAEHGVTVRVLYDSFGSAASSFRLFFRRYRKTPNLKVIGFSQVNILQRKFQLNNRIHRKLLIIDNEVAFTGGINFHDVYLPRDDEEGVRDYNFTLRGPVVLDLQYTFLRDWYYMTKEAAENLLSTDYFPVPESQGSSAIRIINSGPTRDEKAIMLDTMVAAANIATKQLLILTPYFVPPRSLILALRLAAHRGIDVRVLVPAKNNHPSLQQASHALYEPLLLSGVRIFERNPPFIHAKATLIDNQVAIIGSANLDPRSLYLNYETSLVVFDSEFTMSIKRAMHEEFSHSVEITHVNWNKRSKMKRFMENFLNLFHPIA